MSTLGAKLGPGGDSSAATWADFKQDWLMQGCAAEVAVVGVRSDLRATVWAADVLLGSIVRHGNHQNSRKNGRHLQN